MSPQFWLVAVCGTIALFLQGDDCLRIQDLTVPNVVENGSKKDLVLDCDYAFDNTDDRGLVVKWFLNEGETPVYQWIPPKPPQDFGKLKFDGASLVNWNDYKNSMDLSVSPFHLEQLSQQPSPQDMRNYLEGHILKPSVPSPPSPPLISQTSLGQETSLPNPQDFIRHGQGQNRPYSQEPLPPDQVSCQSSPIQFTPSTHQQQLAALNALLQREQTLHPDEKPRAPLLQIPIKQVPVVLSKPNCQVPSQQELENLKLRHGQESQGSQKPESPKDQIPAVSPPKLQVLSPLQQQLEILKALILQSQKQGPIHQPAPLSVHQQLNALKALVAPYQAPLQNPSSPILSQTPAQLQQVQVLKNLIKLKNLKTLQYAKKLAHQPTQQQDLISALTNMLSTIWNNDKSNQNKVEKPPQVCIQFIDISPKLADAILNKNPNQTENKQTQSAVFVNNVRQENPLTSFQSIQPPSSQLPARDSVGETAQSNNENIPSSPTVYNQQVRKSGLDENYTTLPGTYQPNLSEQRHPHNVNTRHPPPHNPKLTSTNASAGRSATRDFSLPPPSAEASMFSPTAPPSHMSNFGNR